MQHYAKILLCAAAILPIAVPRMSAVSHHRLVGDTSLIAIPPPADTMLLQGREYKQIRLSRSLLREIDTAGYSHLDFSHAKHPWKGIVEVGSANLLFHLLTRYAANKDYARISWHSIKNNFETGFLWDNDKFETNLFYHPYQGGLYFNCARSNGLNFWQSAPYAFSGSLVWEMMMETQPPSTNDIIATSLGGIGLGEVSHRLSSLVLDGRCTGMERVIREIAGAVIDPVRGANRLISGDSWHPGDRYVDREATIPFSLQYGIGYRYLKETGKTDKRYNSMACADFTLIYNNPFDIEGRQPFEYFSAQFAFNYSGRQPFLGTVKFNAVIWGHSHDYHSGQEMFWGIFQNYNYYNSEALKRGSEDIPFRIAETVSYGPGMMVRFPFPLAKGSLTLTGFTSGILLGGSLSEYYKFQERDYNMGSGYSLRCDALLVFYRKFGLYAAMENYRIFTWKGYEKKDYEHIDPNYLNAQGARGNALLRVVTLRGSFNLYRDICLSAQVGWYRRNSHYKYFPDVHSHAFDARLMVSYVF